FAMSNRRKNAARLNVEQLEAREVPTVQILPSSPLLTIRGDDAANAITVLITDNNITVQASGLATWTGAAKDYSQINIGGKGGDDTISVTESTPTGKSLAL